MRPSRTAGRVSGPSTLRFGGIETPVGPVHVALSPQGVCRVSFRARGPRTFLQDLERRFSLPVRAGGQRVAGVLRQLEEYFRGKRKRFACPLDLSGLTPFEREVLRSAGRVPFGRLISYGDLAGRIGRPRAARAVGNALGKNPVPILIPCHRVIAGSGHLGGFTGGTRVKTILLRHEGHEPLRNHIWGSSHETIC